MTTIFAAQVQAMRTDLFEVETTSTQGYSGLHLIGNVTKVCEDGKERVRAALESQNVMIPAKRIVTSIAPAELRKDGSQFDLPIAVSVWLFLNKLPAWLEKERWLFIGELGLNGDVRPVKGVIPFLLRAIQSGMTGMVLPTSNLTDVQALRELCASQMSHLRIVAVQHLTELLPMLTHATSPAATPLAEPEPLTEDLHPTPNYDDMVLSPPMRKAALVAACGHHNVLLRGVPGSGKSMWAQRLASILPNLPKQERIEVLNIHSIHAHAVAPRLVQGFPPMRSPHHSASNAAILGGVDAPGEISLAHQGILFLDEFPEFRRDIIESLREPLETGHIMLSRRQAKVCWDARVLLIAACNNCPCGWYGSRHKRCRCTINALMNYQKKLSGPLLDRIDIHLSLTQSMTKDFDALLPSQHKHQHRDMSACVERGQEFAWQRNQQWQLRYNSQLKAEHLLAASCVSERNFKTLLQECLPPNLSVRSVVRIVRVARSLADLVQRRELQNKDLKQAFEWHYESQHHFNKTQ